MISEIYHKFVDFIVSSIFYLGYFGIFFLMFLESSFFPFPSEVVMIPAGYLASKGDFNLFLVIFMGILGSIFGAWFNYFLANKFGRKILLKFLKKHHLEKVENFFEKHGEISTFNGRLIPVVRQYISFPAGLAKMSAIKFTIYTGLGASIWVIILTLLGYYLGENEDLIKLYLKEITIVFIIGIILITVIYLYFLRKRKK
jgi:membrane protein DedA with SNARE-associated domain